MQEAMRHLQSTLARAFVMGILILSASTVAHTAPVLISTGACTVTATPIAFGMYNPMRHRDLAAVGMLHYRCFGTHQRLAIGLTTGESGSFRARSMGHGRYAIIYNLYLDAAGAQIWGDGTRGSQMYIVNSPTSESDVDIPIYGRVFGDQNASAGNYQDDVSVVVTY